MRKLYVYWPGKHKINVGHFVVQSRGRFDCSESVFYLRPASHCCLCVRVTKTPSTGLRHPSTTTVFSYAIGSRKLSANERFFVGAQTDGKFVTNNPNKTRRAWAPPTKFTPAQIRPQSFESRRNSFFYPGWMRPMFTCMFGR